MEPRRTKVELSGERGVEVRDDHDLVARDHEATVGVVEARVVHDDAVGRHDVDASDLERASDLSADEVGEKLSRDGPRERMVEVIGDAHGEGEEADDEPTEPRRHAAHEARDLGADATPDQNASPIVRCTAPANFTKPRSTCDVGLSEPRPLTESGCPSTCASGT